MNGINPNKINIFNPKIHESYPHVLMIPLAQYQIERNERHRQMMGWSFYRIEEAYSFNLLAVDGIPMSLRLYDFLWRAIF